jgi:HTH-type transcriptional regulator/antitoxin HigA
MKMRLNQSQLTKLMQKEPDHYDVAAGKAMSRKEIKKAFLTLDDIYNWELFPVREMVKYGWIKASADEIRKHHVYLIKKFFAPIQDGPDLIFCRRSIKAQTETSEYQYAITAWMVRILIRAKHECCAGSYTFGSITPDFLGEVAKLSRYEDGPIRAKEFLSKHGIAMIVERHLSGTHLDGATTLSPDHMPVIGLSLRRDRVDNFWFTLLHELAHVVRHLPETSTESFIDDFDEEPGDPREKEADRLALDTLVPRTIWKRSDAYRTKTPEAVISLANQLGIHPGVIAGRIQNETGRYSILREFIDKTSIRKFFPETNWN